MMSKPDHKLKPNLFKKEPNSIQYDTNFAVEWKTKMILLPFRNLNYFPLNPLNEYRTIMQSKNCQELPFKHGNFLVQEMLAIDKNNIKSSNKHPS